MKSKITYARSTARLSRIDWRDNDGNTIRIVIDRGALAAARKVAKEGKKE